MRTLLEFDELATSSDETLKRLGFRFYRNQSRSVVEFEVTEPAEFLVRIEKLSGEGMRPEPFFGALGIFGGGDGVGNAFSVTPGARRSECKAQVAAFVKGLLGALPRQPWDGLGFVEKRTSKAYWRGLTEA